MLKLLQAATVRGSNIDLSAWENKINPSESRFPAQVRKLFSISFLLDLNQKVMLVHYSDVYLLWNPSTNESVQLPYHEFSTG